MNISFVEQKRTQGSKSDAVPKPWNPVGRLLANLLCRIQMEQYHFEPPGSEKGTQKGKY